MKTHLIEILARAIADKQPAVLATVVEVKGGSPAKVGAQIVLLEDGSTAGTVGGGKLESAILDDARLTWLDQAPCGVGQDACTKQKNDRTQQSGR